MTAWLGVTLAALVVGYVTSFRAGALRTAVANACDSPGGIETNPCENTPPESVAWLPWRGAVPLDRAGRPRPAAAS